MALENIINKAKQAKGVSVVAESTGATVPLEKIKDRESNTRDLNPQHVDTLAESIAILGLIEPLAVDKNYILLAGGHRKAAITQLKEQNPSAYKQHFADGIPVRVMEFDASADPDKALQIEIAENEQRRDYTPAEVRVIANRLREAGYTETVGRPKKGELALKPALSVVVGKSIRQIKRYLTDDEENPASVPISPETHIRRAIASLKKWETSRGRKRKEVELAKELPDILAKLKALVEEN
jgi:ParB family chromosome partitioning protein